jgi:hypothetical protein
MDPKQCQQRTRDPLQTPKSDGSQQRIPFRHQHLLEIHISTMVHFRNQKSEENPNHNHRITNKLHLRNQNLMELNLNNLHVHLVHIRNKTSDVSEQDMNQTQVFFPGSDYRILRRQKSRRRIGTPQLSDNRINRNRSWYKIGFNFYNKSSLQRTNYPSARHNDSAKVKHTYTTSGSQTKDAASATNIWQPSYKNDPRTVMSDTLTNPDSQSDTQEAIQSERAKGTPLIQPS